MDNKAEGIGLGWKGRNFPFMKSLFKDLKDGWLGLYCKGELA